MFIDTYFEKSTIAAVTVKHRYTLHSTCMEFYIELHEPLPHEAERIRGQIRNNAPGHFK